MITGLNEQLMDEAR